MAAASTSDAIEQLAASLARARGDNFFPELAAHLASVSGASEAIICEIAPTGALARSPPGVPAPSWANYDYDLDATPCAAVQAGQILTVDLADGAYPRAFRRSGGYFGMPLSANDGAVLGHLCVYTDQPVTFAADARAVCDIIADRAAAELRLIHVKRERALLRGQRRLLRAEIAAGHDVEAMVGVSAAHLRMAEEIRHASQSTVSVLIRGEPGTGKELVARAIHATSARAPKPFVKIDCAALYIEAHLNALPQTFALAGGGTVFLDEVGALAPEMQDRLLSSLSAEAVVRIIASTSRDLRRMVRDGDFRDALQQRLAAFTIDLAPLRARVEDIPLLVQNFVQKYTRRLGRRVELVDPASLAELADYAWPGNIRELANLVERSLVIQDTPTLKISHEMLAPTARLERAELAAAAAGDATTASRSALAGPVDFDDTLSTGLHVIQRDHILRVLDSTHWVIEGSHGAALKLGLKPATLRHRMKKLGISRKAHATPSSTAAPSGSEAG
jgi:transcriptional regulator with GAF, ATPase, and Fis domain